MLRKALALVLYLVVGLALIVIIQDDTFSLEKIRQLTKIVDAAIQKYHIPGAVVGIWQGKKSWVYAAGLSDIKTKSQMQPGYKFRIASNTKTFTSTVVLQLVDEKKLSLDDKLAKFFPQIPNSKKITIRQLLNHTSGIFDFVEDENFQKMYMGDPLRKLTPQEEIDIVLGHEPDFAPGKKWKYSNSNYALLGMIIEKITGSKIEDEVEKRIIKPLKLSQTSFPVTPEMTGEYSHGYMVPEEDLEDVEELEDVINVEDLEDITLVNPSIPWAGGGMVSNVYDLKKWIRAVVRGELLSWAMRKERFHWIPTNTKDMEFGLGIMKLQDFIGHNGKILGYASFILYSPKKDTTIVLFINKCNEVEKEDPMSDIIRGIMGIIFLN
jgi:D-alanyl-D-alanine carboxypeptidase